MVNHDTHETVLRGARFTGAGKAPAILRHTDQQFVEALLGKLASEKGRARLENVAKRKGVLELYQPVHRVFYMALLEVHCDQPGEPRLDPARIESAGLLIRRVADDGVSPEGWCEAENVLRGWVELSRQEAEADPDPERRSAPGAGHPEIDRRLIGLTAATAPLAERVSPLFTAPPEVCKAAGRTLLYGFIPLASSETSEAATGTPAVSDKELEELFREEPILRRQFSDRAAFVKRLGTVAPGEGRYDEIGRRYRLRTFARVRRSDGCPPDLVWSAASAPFTIVPWYASSDVAPVRITLPDVTDKKVLKKLKPDVTFVVPPKIHALFEVDDLDNLKSFKGNGLGVGWRWLCGFNIPIITVCAILVLSIFLNLFNFIFAWLPFVRICIPIPVPKKK